MSDAADSAGRFQSILGIRFYTGEAQGIIDLVSQGGGLLVAPAAPALKNIPHNRDYREALAAADYAIADSAFMVMIWNLIGRERITKLSGLKYLRLLVEQAHFRAEGASFWVMPSADSAAQNAGWLAGNGFALKPEHIYVAPHYGENVDDAVLLERLRVAKPRHIVICVGGGTQERLGHYLKLNLDYSPAIHCIGAAIAFLSGDQVHIPVWADTLGLGWLWRCVSNPKQNVKRYWDARHLLPLMLRYRERCPVTSLPRRPLAAEPRSLAVEPLPLVVEHRVSSPDRS